MERRLFLAGLAASACVRGAEIVDVRKIWDEAPHNAFTDLIRFRNRWYCTFREGKGHVSPDGSLRILTSSDGEKWESAALIASKLGDLRDAKLSVAPGNRLMLLGAAALPPGGPHRHQSLVWFTGDGKKWTEGQPVADPDYWLWRVTWHKGAAYGLAYSTAQDRNRWRLRLYKSTDGKRFETLVADTGIANAPNESAIRFRADGTAVALVRRDPYKGDPPIPESAATALIGTARAPYTDWQWKDTGVRVGGPNLLLNPAGDLAVVRLYDGGARTSLCRVDTDAAKIEEVLKLPSGGDNSYAGMVMHEGLLWSSYYSSHEGKTSIYLAKLRLA